MWLVIAVLLLVVGILAYGGSEGFSSQVIGAGNDQLTTETIVYRPAWNHNTITLPVGPSAGRMLLINLTGGGPLRSSDYPLYTPVSDDSFNNKSATGQVSAGSTIQLANNRNHIATFDGARWVVM